MPSSRLQRLLLVGASLGLCACASDGPLPKGGVLAKPPSTPNGFVSNAEAKVVIAEAHFYTDHERIFGDDLLEEEGILPIALKIGLHGRDIAAERVQLTPEQMDFRLYLQDGTPLRAVAYASIAKDDEKINERVTALALRAGWLAPFRESKEGFVFFRLKPEKAFEVDDGDLLHDDGDVRRTLDVSRSLLAFRLTQDGETAPFYIGITREVRSAR
jgi:hypothetical protein